MKALGGLVVLAIVVGCGLYFGGYIDGDADAKLTDKGRATYNKGVDEARDGINGLRLEAADVIAGEAQPKK